MHKKLVVYADKPDREIWVGDEEGNFVQKETGKLDTGLLPGKYTVEFGLGTARYLLDLQEDMELNYDSIQKYRKPS